MKHKESKAQLTKIAVLLYDEVMKFAYAQTKDREAACDIAQNVMEIAISRIDTLRNRNTMKQWIMRITGNEIRNYFRMMHFEQSHTVPKPETEEGFPELRDVKADILGNLVDRESGQTVMKALHMLEEPYREIIRYHVIYEWPLTAVAEHLGINYNTVKTRYIRGIKKLKELFLMLEAGGEE
ncbi:MAG: RNA polymerase sigma factor [Lachnospiraceae bacterium]|nr:RNA polymerase sigma factor [Lachnospiraceae bacterium]